MFFTQSNKEAPGAFVPLILFFLIYVNRLKFLLLIAWDFLVKNFYFLFIHASKSSKYKCLQIFLSKIKKQTHDMSLQKKTWKAGMKRNASVCKEN